MKRRAFQVAVLLSLVLCVVIVGAWAKGPWGFDRRDQRRLIIGDSAYFLASRGGGLRVMRQRATTSVASGPGDATADPGRLGFWQIQMNGAVMIGTRFGPPEPDHTFLGFGWGRTRYSKMTDWYRGDDREITRSTLDYAVAAAPYWALLLAASLLPALWLRGRFRSRSRILAGRCAGCGYDLRVTPGQCPECGAMASTTPDT